MSTESTTGTAPGQPGKQDRVTLLCVGGPRDGQEVSVPAGARYWVDLASAETYRRQWFSARPEKAVGGRPIQMWRRYALVWDAIPVPDSIPLLADRLIAQWVMAGGEQVPVSSIELAAPLAPDLNGGILQ